MADGGVWQARSPWAGIAERGRFALGDGGVGVTIRLVEGGARFDILAAPGQAEALKGAIRAAFGAELVDGPKVVTGGDMAFLGTGPGRWSVVGDDPDIGAWLSAAVGALGSVIDQSSARATLVISGPHVAEVLKKGFVIDIHPAAFGPDDIAVTTVAHMSVTLRRLGDGFEITGARSMTGSLWHWVTASAAEYGYEVD